MPKAANPNGRTVMSHTPLGGQASDQANAGTPGQLLEAGVGQIKPKTHEVSQIVGHDTATSSHT